MANYTLIASASTVQVLSPTVTNPVVYCTIQTHPSNVIASIPVQQSVFDANEAGVELGNFAGAIEQLMTNTHVSSGTGSQQIDDNGLLADFVTFTVFYVPPGGSGASVTAEASVPVGLLNFTDAEIGRVVEGEAEAIINGVYGNLKSAASG